MTENNKTEVSRRGFSHVLVDIRNGALILASLAIAFHFTIQPGFQTSSTEPSPIKVSDVKTAMAQQAAVKSAAEPAESITGIPTSEIIAALAARTEAVKSGKPVVQKADVIAETSSQSAIPKTSVQPVTTPQSVAPTQGKQALRLGVRTDGTEMSEAEKVEQIQHLISALPESFTINWPAENEKIDLYVFSDPTCSYCRKLHQSIPQLNQAGISVHYFMYPRDMPLSTATSLSPTAQNLNNIWCSVDQRAAFDEAFMGYKVRAADCASLPAELNRPASPLMDHYFLGTLFDVRGTPTVVTSTGLKFEGFSDAATLIQKVLPQQ